MKNYLLLALLSAAPVSELRGAIPFAFASGIPLRAAIPLAVCCNALVCPAALFFLEFFHKIFYKWGLYARLFDRLVVRARKKMSVQIERHGTLGIFLFVAVPLPMTGAWTGTLGAWILGVEKKKIAASVFLGVSAAAIVVSAATILGASGLKILR